MDLSRLWSRFFGEHPSDPSDSEPMPVLQEAICRTVEVADSMLAAVERLEAAFASGEQHD